MADKGNLCRMKSFLFKERLLGGACMHLNRECGKVELPHLGSLYRESIS